MKALLLHVDRDFDAEHALPPQERDLTQDLALPTLLNAMSHDDKFVFNIARQVLLASTENSVETIRHRQAALRDCLKNAQVVRQLYDLAAQTLEKRKHSWFGVFMRSPSSIVHSSIDILRMFIGMLRQVRDLAATQASGFESSAFVTLFETLRRECGEDYLSSIEQHLTDLKFRRGVLLSAQLGEHNEGTRYVLRAQDKPLGWLGRLLRPAPPGYSFRVHERDEPGLSALAEIQDQGINAVGNALAQSADHILGFFKVLHTELAFYVGCLNLRDALKPSGVPICFPEPEPQGTRGLQARELRDPSLVLSMGHGGVGNALAADGRNLIVITGANHGGKSSLLRATGLAQLMMQAGMFVTAKSFEAELCTDIFTHFKREEDAGMQHGKFDEEAARMSSIADAVRPNALVLFNESFASTNEREGSEVARQVVRALREKGIKVFFVTHLYDFAHSLFVERTDDMLFLRAERREDGSRTFRLIEGEPLDTSYGEDLYQAVFEARSPATGEATGEVGMR
jgi:hypothetical protein